MTEEKFNLPEHVQREIGEFFELLGSKDDITPMMLRLHLTTENLLERIIILKLPKGWKLLEKANFSYSQKLEVVNALDMLPSDLVGSLRQLNKVRNAASHTKEGSVGKPEIDRIGTPLGKDYLKCKADSHADMKLLAMSTFAKLYARLYAIVARSEHKESGSNDEES